MKVLLISALADSLALAIRLLAEGHDVKMYIHSEAEQDAGDGIVPKVESWREHVEEAELVIFDDVEQETEEDEAAYRGGKWYQEIREEHPDKLVIGGSSWTSKLENDRLLGQEVLQQAGVPVAPMQRFTDFEEAVSFVAEAGGAWALKHNNQVSRSLAHVSFDPEDMIEFLEFLAENWEVLAPGKDVDFVLQEAVKGIELAVTCFFDGERFRTETCYLNQEIKRFMNDDLGPPTGQQGEVGIVIPNARLFQAALAQVAPMLQVNGYCQFIDLNCIVAGPDKVVPLEFTARPGYPTIWSIIELLDEPVGQFLVKMASRSPELARFYRGWACNVVLTTGMYPYSSPTNSVSILRGVDKTGLRHVHLTDVKWKDGQLHGAGDTGYLATVTGRGRSIREAQEKAYGVLKQLSVVPFSQYRTDIGLKSVEEFQKLAQWGWLR